MKTPRTVLPHLARWSIGIGLAILCLNVYGLTRSPRSPLAIMVPGDFSHDETIDAETAWERLGELDPSDRAEFALRSAEIFGQAIRHEPFTGVSDDPDVFAAAYLTIPIWENYLLWALRYLKPDTYLSYQFNDYRRALERGVGQCGQQVMALIEYLREHDFNTGFVELTEHVVATVEVAPDVWYTLDPDFGVAAPYSIEEMASDEGLLETYYGEFTGRSASRIYRTAPPVVTYGGVEVRYPRASRVELWAYIGKWAIPIVLVLAGAAMSFLVRRGRLDEA